MQCQSCGLRPATVHVTRIVQGQVEQAHLCAQCAQESGEINILANPAALLQSLLANFAGQGQAFQTETEMRCPSCGFLFNDFRETGLLGCPSCYAHFRSELEPMLRRLHGTTEHRGKLPHRRGGAFERDRHLQAMRRELQQAVGREEYEQAARLRDEIKQLEAEGG
jgi:protein arginine kinase activator